MGYSSNIEYQQLHPLITYAEVEDAVETAIIKKWKGINLPPFWIKKAKRDIGNRALGLTTVVGYPLGYQRSEAKALEVELGMKDGATELEITMNLSAIKVNQPAWVKIELMRLGKVIHDQDKFMTAIIELQLLNEEEALRACRLSREGGSDYVKNTTDLNLPFEKVLEQVKFLKANLATDVGIKAAGKIETHEQIEKLIEAGAEVVCVSGLIRE